MLFSARRVFQIVAANIGAFAGTPPWPPQGGAGDGSAAIVNGWGYALGMRTQALRVTVGAYSSGEWHVGIIIDTYDRGILVNSELDEISHYKFRDEVREAVRRALDRCMQMESERIAREATESAQAAHSVVSKRRAVS